ASQQPVAGLEKALADREQAWRATVAPCLRRSSGRFRSRCSLAPCSCLQLVGKIATIFGNNAFREIWRRAAKRASSGFTVRVVVSLGLARNIPCAAPNC